MSPLMEAIFEVRFQPSLPTAGDLLPGLLFEKLGPEYPNVEQLPVGTIPREMREKDANLHYLATYRLSGGSRWIQVGDRVATVSVGVPYPGWTRFKDAILQMLRIVAGTTLMREPERFSFRYINVIPAQPDRPQLPLLSVRTSWPGHEFTERGFQLRFEVEDREYITVVQIAPQVTLKKPDSLVSGLMVDVDTIRTRPARDFWEGDAALLEDAHSVVKQTFFTLLDRSTLERLGPVYDAATV